MVVVISGKHSKVILYKNIAIKQHKYKYNYLKEKFFLSKRFWFMPKLLYSDDKKLILIMENAGKPFLNLKPWEKLYTLIVTFFIMVFLDLIKIKKEEMHRPIKHIFLKGPRVILIDWERSHIGKGNLTQYVQFVCRDKCKDLAKKYKKNPIYLLPLFIRFLVLAKNLS
ncbi:NEQ071 [Nanoarchaeum equitans Kin4-M]|uniref:NEQ071 n=1 Tax=Nanoarchaeum equitans (strain Kin4-M) TaxID=228908 RepID=Q74N70_NANEQ|nr:NEQ071 [Nanoarchaeum equitans Kin4-M]